MDILRAGRASFFVAWRAEHTSWQRFMSGDTPFSEPGAPLLLLAHPQVSRLNGSGEAIALLETWYTQATRAQGRSRSVIQPEPLLASTHRRVESAAPRGTQSSGTQAIPSPSGGRSHDSYMSPDVFGNPGAISTPMVSHEQAEEKTRVSSHRAALMVSSSVRLPHTAHTSSSTPMRKETPSDDEPEFIEDTTPSSTRTPSHHAAHTSSSTPMRKETPSDDEPEFVEDITPSSTRTPSHRATHTSSSTPMRKETPSGGGPGFVGGITPSSARTPSHRATHTSSSAPMHKETPSDDEPEFVEDTTPSSTRTPSHPKPRVGSNRRTTEVCASTPLVHASSARSSPKTPRSDDKVEFMEDISVPTPSAGSRLHTTPKRHHASSRKSHMGPAAHPSLDLSSKFLTTAIVVDDEDDEDDVIDISGPTPTIAPSDNTTAALVNRSLSVAASGAVRTGDTTDADIDSSLPGFARASSAPEDADIVEISRPSFWAKHTRGAESPRIKTKRPRPRSWHVNRAVSKTSHPARALPSGSADDSDAVEITPPTRKKLKSGSPQPYAGNPTPSPLPVPNVRDCDRVTDPRQGPTKEAPPRDHGAGNAPTRLNTSSSAAMSYERPEFVQGSSRSPLFGGDLETNRSYEGVLVNQEPQSSSSDSSKEGELGCNGQEVIDLTEE